MCAHGKILYLAGTILLAALLLCILAGVATAGEETEAVGPPQKEMPVQEEKSFTDKMVEIGTSVGKSHDQFEQDILAQVMRLDNFFGSVQTESLRKTSYAFRLRSGIRFEEGRGVRPDITLRANIVLPKISKKLRLVISGENQLENPSPALPEDPGNPGFDRTTQPTTRVVNTEFRYELIKKPNRDLFVGAGVKVALPLVPFVRARFQYTHNFSNVFLIRLGETLFVKTGDGVGETTLVNLERLLDKDTLLRLANSATLSQEFNGLEWGAELSWIRGLTPLSAITFTGGIYGNSSLSAVVSNHRLLSRYRRNFLKEWLFYELEPEISWPINSNGTRSSRYALTFRLEILFAKSAGK